MSVWSMVVVVLNEMNVLLLYYYYRPVAISSKDDLLLWGRTGDSNFPRVTVHFLRAVVVPIEVLSVIVPAQTT